VTGLHRWALKSKFRANAYGWRGSALAAKRLKEAVSEITAVAKSDRVLAGEGIVSLIENAFGLPFKTSIRPRAHLAVSSTARSTN
jgi:hypothetical protein